MSIPLALTQRGVGRQRRWEARIGEVTADGKTKTDAKAAVEALAVAALSGDSAPRLLRVPGSPLLLVVWREPVAGWCQKVVCAAPADPPEPERLWGTTGYDSAADAERRGRRHLAQLVYDLHGEAAAFAVLDDPADHAELGRWIGFQRAYRAAETNGEPDPRGWASQHANDDAFAAQVPPAT